MRLLDAGTGRGDIALHCARLHPDWRVHGIDLEDDRVERCRTGGAKPGAQQRHLQPRQSAQSVSDRQYDLITNTDVLEHIEDDRGAMTNLARALAPGGYLLLTFPSVPQRRHLKMVAWRERRIGFKPEDIGHVRPGYSPDMINGLAREVGLEPVKTVWTYGPFGNLAHDLFFVLGDSKPNPIVFAASLPFLLALSFLENHTPTRHGSGLARDREETSRAMKASIFILMDALGWEWIKEHPFLKEVAPYRRPLDSVLGFSTAAIPSILTGRFPEEHGRLSLFHRANGHSPFSKLKFICAMPPWMVENRYARFGVKTLARRMNNLTGYFQLYGVPLKYLPKLDVCEKRNIYAPGGIPGSTSIFDLLHGGGKSYRTYCYHDGTDDQLIASMEADLRAGAAKFYFLYLAELDYFLHLHADDRAAAAETLQKYSDKLARLHAYRHRRPTARRIFTSSAITGWRRRSRRSISRRGWRRCRLRRRSITCACWIPRWRASGFFNARARELVTAALSEVDGGRWLDADDLVNLHSWFPDAKYGEKIFLTESGTVIAPSHMGARRWRGCTDFFRRRRTRGRHSCRASTMATASIRSPTYSA